MAGRPVIGTIDAASRRRWLNELVDGRALDVLVVGGGITGAGVALDAASRGLSVALVERRDLAFGTSRWSSKLVHGGLRYLARGQLDVAYESARERHVLLTRTAPHLVHPLPFVVPLTDDLRPVAGALAQLGLYVGDALRVAAGTRGCVLPAAGRLSAQRARALVPALGPMRGALHHFDGRLEDDARLVLAVTRTAVAHGARVLTQCAATSVDGDGAEVRDELTGQGGRIRARRVVVATGVWAPQLVPSVRLRPSRGSHLLVRAAALGDPQAGLTAIVPGTTNRWVLAYPTGDGTVVVGLTDEAVEGEPPDEPRVPEADASFLLSTLNRVLATPVTAGDVVGSFAGLRPLLDADGETADLSRRHALLTSEAGVLTLIGGKLTTYRRMAQDAVDRIAQELGHPGRCRTAGLPLLGAAPPAELAAVPAPARLVRRYGTEAPAVAALAEGRPDLLAPVVPGAPTLGVELLFGALHEGALDADDLLDRRVRLGLVPAWREAARPLAEELLAAAPA